MHKRNFKKNNNIEDASLQITRIFIESEKDLIQISRTRLIEMLKKGKPLQKRYIPILNHVQNN
jgi:hypothetical protein